MPTPNEIKVAKILANHKANIEESKLALAAQQADIDEIKTGVAKVAASPILHNLPWRWTIGAWSAVAVMLLIVSCMTISLVTTRHMVTELQDQVDRLKPRKATDAEIRAMIDAQPAAEVAAALGPVKRHKRVVVDAGATQVSSEPAAPAVQAGALPAGGQ